MSIHTVCPGCGTSVKAPDGSEGKKARCKACQTVFVIGSPPPTATPADGIEVACPNCKKRFLVDLGGMAPKGSLRVACDHCGVEKKLSVFQQELARQVNEKLEKERREGAEKRLSAFQQELARQVNEKLEKERREEEQRRQEKERQDRESEIASPFDGVRADSIEVQEQPSALNSNRPPSTTPEK